MHPNHGHKRDEILEALWTMAEDQLQTGADLAARVESTRLDTIVDELIAAGDVMRDGDKLTLTDSGRVRAAQIIRRHRLAERMFCDLFGLEEHSWEASACTFEHILDETVTQSVCAFLGHPSVCPHGKPIPPGACCSDNHKPIEPVVIPLKELKVGQSGRIAYITPRTTRRLSRLVSYGVIPGSEVKLNQRFPSYVIRIDQTDVALETEIAKEIFVRVERE